jgi:hypothetical protein
VFAFVFALVASRRGCGVFTLWLRWLLLTDRSLVPFLIWQAAAVLAQQHSMLSASGRMLGRSDAPPAFMVSASDLVRLAHVLPRIPSSAKHLSFSAVKALLAKQARCAPGSKPPPRDGRVRLLLVMLMLVLVRLVLVLLLLALVLQLLLLLRWLRWERGRLLTHRWFARRA